MIQLTPRSRKRSKRFLIDIGDGNAVQKPLILAILDYFSSPVKRYVSYKNQRAELIDATKGKAVKSVVVMVNGYVFLSSRSVDQLSAIINGGGVDEASG